MRIALQAAIAFLWSALFKPVLGSVNGALIPGELRKAFAAALAVGSLVGGAIAALNAVLPDLPAVFSSPAISGLVTFVITQLLAQLGQLPQTQTGWHVETLTSPSWTRLSEPPAA